MFDSKCVQSSNCKELGLKNFRFLTAKYSTLQEIQMFEKEANVVGRLRQLLLTMSRIFLQATKSIVEKSCEFKSPILFQAPLPTKDDYYHQGNISFESQINNGLMAMFLIIDKALVLRSDERWKQ